MAAHTHMHRLGNKVIVLENSSWTETKRAISPNELCRILWAKLFHSLESAVMRVSLSCSAAAGDFN